MTIHQIALNRALYEYVFENKASIQFQGNEEQYKAVMRAVTATKNFIAELNNPRVDLKKFYVLNNERVKASKLFEETVGYKWPF